MHALEILARWKQRNASILLWCATTTTLALLTPATLKQDVFSYLSLEHNWMTGTPALKIGAIHNLESNTPQSNATKEEDAHLEDAILLWDASTLELFATITTHALTILALKEDVCIPQRVVLNLLILAWQALVFPQPENANSFAVTAMITILALSTHATPILVSADMFPTIAEIAIDAQEEDAFLKWDVFIALLIATTTILALSIHAIHSLAASTNLLMLMTRTPAQETGVTTGTDKSNMSPLSATIRILALLTPVIDCWVANTLQSMSIKLTKRVKTNALSPDALSLKDWLEHQRTATTTMLALLTHVS